MFYFFLGCGEVCGCLLIPPSDTLTLKAKVRTAEGECLCALRERQTSPGERRKAALTVIEEEEQEETSVC